MFHWANLFVQAVMSKLTKFKSQIILWLSTRLTTGVDIHRTGQLEAFYISLLQKNKEVAMRHPTCAIHRASSNTN